MSAYAASSMNLSNGGGIGPASGRTDDGGEQLQLTGWLGTGNNPSIRPSMLLPVRRPGSGRCVGFFA